MARWAVQSVVPDEVSGRVQLAVDLIDMRYTPHHPWAADALRPALDGSGRLVIPHRTLDLHIHLPTTSVLEVGEHEQAGRQAGA